MYNNNNYNYMGFSISALGDIGSALGAVGSIAGGIMNYKAQQEANEQNYRVFRENLDWNKPINVVRRLQDANLNPALAYGSPSTVQAPQFHAPQIDLSGSLQQALNGYIQLQQIKNLKEDTRIKRGVANEKNLQNQKLAAEVAIAKSEAGLKGAAGYINPNTGEINDGRGYTQNKTLLNIRNLLGIRSGSFYKDLIKASNASVQAELDAKYGRKPVSGKKTNIYTGLNGNLPYPIKKPGFFKRYF